MPAKAGQIVIDVRAGTSKFVVDMEKANASIRSLGTAAGSGRAETTAFLKEAHGNILNNTRAASAFITTVLGGGKAMQALFPIVGGIAFAGMLVDLGSKVVDFFKKMEQGPEKAAGAWYNLIQPLHLTNLELELANAKLDQDIAKLEGKRTNNLVVALEEAKVAAAKLGAEFEKSLQSMYKLFKEQDSGAFGRLLSGVPSLGALEKRIGGGTGSGGMDATLRGINRQEEHDLDAVDLKNPEAAKKQIKAITDAAIQARMDVKTELDKAINAELPKQEALTKVGYGAYGALFGSADKAQANVEALKRAKDDAAEMIRHMNDMSRNATLTGRKTELEPIFAQNQKDQEGLNRLNEELLKIQDKHLEGLQKIAAEEKAEIARLVLAKSLSQKDVDSGKVNAGNNSLLSVLRDVSNSKTIDLYYETLVKSNKQLEESEKHWMEIRKEMNHVSDEAYKKFFDESLKNLERLDKAVAKLNDEYLKLTVTANRQNLEHRVNMVGITGQRSDPIGTLEKQQALEKADIQRRYNDALAEANKTLKGAELIETQRNLLTEKKLEWDRLDYELQEKKAQDAKTIRGNLDAGSRDAKSGKEIANDAINNAEDQVSGQLAKLFTGQKTSFAAMFKSMGESLIKETLKATMQKALGHLFGTHKPKGTPNDLIHVWDHSPKGGNNGKPPELPEPPTPGGGGASPRMPSFGLGGAGSAVGGGAGLAGLGGAAGGVGDGLTPSVTSSVSFGGFMAEGGDVDPGHSYIVGENEPERFTPKSAGTISPMTKRGGGGDTHIYSIDARGAALGVENRISRSIDMAHSSAISHSVRANEERKNRNPQRKN